MSYNFHVGQKVVCVDDSPIVRKKLLLRGCIYTITRAWVTGPEATYKGILGPHPVFDLAEVENPVGHGFNRKRFRPLRKSETDLSLFKALLTPSDATEDA